MMRSLSEFTSLDRSKWMSFISGTGEPSTSVVKMFSGYRHRKREGKQKYSQSQSQQMTQYSDNYNKFNINFLVPLVIFKYSILWASWLLNVYKSIGNLSNTSYTHGMSLYIVWDVLLGEHQTDLYWEVSDVELMEIAEGRGNLLKAGSCTGLRQTVMRCEVLKYVNSTNPK